jgi:very-short-patch-repair endonuclease
MQQQFWNTQQLRAAGVTKRRTAEGVAAGELLVVRRGHYAVAGTPAPLVRAARVGGVVTASTAAAELRLWTPPDARLHVAVPRGAGRLHDPDDPALPFRRRPDVCIHWSDDLRPASLPRRVAPSPLVVEHALSCLPPAWAIAVLDSALHDRLLGRDELRSVVAALPPRLAAVARCADGSSESGLESIARYLLRLAGLKVETQVNVAGVGRVDLLVEGHLILELDGYIWHGDEEAFERDHRRDLAAALNRYRVLRFTYKQVMEDWDSVYAAVVAAL